MIVAVNMVCMNSRLREYFFRIAKAKPQHQFIFIYDKYFEDPSAINANSIIAKIDSLPKSTLWWKYWYDHKLSQLAKKNKADVLVTTGCCSLRTKIPQCLFIDDLSFLFAPQFLTKSQVRFFKNNMPAFLVKAKQVAVHAPFVKTALKEQFAAEESKINIVSSAADTVFCPIDWKEKEAIKGIYAEGKEYFLFSGDLSPANNLFHLLKAFSHFKKWQKSNMQLIITGKLQSGYEKFITSLDTYKYRNEVKILDPLPSETLARITASAYAVLHTVYYDAMPAAALAAFTCEVPVICSNTGGLASLFADAALYADPFDYKDIAAQMILVFKDENKRDQLIRNGKIASEAYSFDKTVKNLWESVKDCTVAHFS